MRYPYSCLAIGVALAFAACGGPPPTQAPIPRAVQVPVPLFAAEDAGIHEDTTEVIKDIDTYRRRWSEATSIQIEPVDFSRHMVLLAAAGAMRRGDRVLIDSLFVREEPDEERELVETMIVQYRIIVGCRRFPTETWPVHIVRAVRFDGRIRWDPKQVTDCPGTP